jgi:anti-sigma B factor antagonist
VRWAGQQALVTLPQHINSANADQIREQLLWIINRGAAVLIADLTETVSCDFSGADVLARAHRRAVANGTELRLVVTADVVRRVLTLNGLDRIVAIYPDLDGALAAGAERPQVHSEPGHAVRAEELLRLVAASMFDVGLMLQAAIGLPPDVTAQRITEALRRLDDAVRDVRDHVFAEPARGIEPRSGLAASPARAGAFGAGQEPLGTAAKARGADGACTAFGCGRYRRAAGAAGCPPCPARTHRLSNRDQAAAGPCRPGQANGGTLGAALTQPPRTPLGAARHLRSSTIAASDVHAGRGRDDYYRRSYGPDRLSGSVGRARTRHLPRSAGNRMARPGRQYAA